LVSFINSVTVKHHWPSLFPVLGSDHGVKAHGDGWILTVALIEGTGIIAAGSSGLYDLYAVFTCNAKRKTSSIKFHTSDPKWNGQFLSS
jgi:Ca2+-dependent lipid-binding protein